MQRITLIRSDDFPPERFTEARDKLALLKPLGSTIYHIGSTSIPGIACKPILDLLLSVPHNNKGIARLDDKQDAFENLGYEVMGEFGIEGRRYYRMFDEHGERLIHLHAFTAQSPHVTRHLAFRDFIRAHPHFARAYSDLKLELFARHDGEREAYMDGKHDFITRCDELALAWIRNVQPDPAKLVDLCHRMSGQETTFAQDEIMTAEFYATLELQSHGELLYTAFLDEVHMHLHKVLRDKLGYTVNMPELEEIHAPLTQALFPMTEEPV